MRTCNRGSGEGGGVNGKDVSDMWEKAVSAEERHRESTGEDGPGAARPGGEDPPRRLVPAMNEQDYLAWVRKRWHFSELNKPARMRLDRDPLYLSGCLMGEAAEAWDVYKKSHRAMRAETSEERDEVILELGDAYHYLTRLADYEGIAMDEVRARNVRKLEERDGAEIDEPHDPATRNREKAKAPPPARGSSDGRWRLRPS